MNTVPAVFLLIYLHSSSGVPIDLWTQFQRCSYWFMNTVPAVFLLIYEHSSSGVPLDLWTQFQRCSYWFMNTVPAVFLLIYEQSSSGVPIDLWTEFQRCSYWFMNTVPAMCSSWFMNTVPAVFLLIYDQRRTQSLWQREELTAFPSLGLFWHYIRSHLTLLGLEELTASTSLSPCTHWTPLCEIYYYYY